MARPHIEFIQSQSLPWIDDGLGADRPGVSIKTLSADPRTGASSMLVRYPAGWTWAHDGALAADEEFLVLDGALAIGRETYARYDYAHWPAGTRRGRMDAPAGAIAITFFSARPAPGPARAGDDPRLIRKLSAIAGEWGGNFHPQFPPGAGRKFLKRDPVTREETWVLGTMPLRSGTKPEKHPVVEEMYLLAGEVAGDRGIMRPGAYFWRPPEQWHGPYGSLTGSLYLFRTIGGALSTVYGEVNETFSWTPAYRPVLPADLGRVAMASAATLAF